MRERLKWSFTWANLGWLAPVAFLALPNCKYHGREVPPNLTVGEEPLSSAIFCEIEDKTKPRHCASIGEILVGIPSTRAAVALARHQSSKIALDYSPEAIAAAGCLPGQPVVVTFWGRYPDGFSACVNCAGVIGPVYPDVNAACVATCEDVVGDMEVPPTPEVAEFCASHARAATNAGNCFDGACTDKGRPRDDFVDPRRTPEPVIWQDLSSGVSTGGADANTLTRTSATSLNFDEGAASTQTITHGDAYVDVIATETDKARVLGLSPGNPPDGDPTDLDIAYGIRLSAGDHVLISENGALQVPPDNDPEDHRWWASYATGDRLRLSLTDNWNGTANITYSLLPASCLPDVCVGIPLRTTGPAPYPFRVDASLRDQGATLTDVRIVRIK